MPFVLDASVSLAWCFEDEETPYALGVFNRLRADRALVPTIWPLEVANTLLVGERRGRLTLAATTRFVRVLNGLPITVDDHTSSAALGSVLALSREHGLSAYDATYLELAVREGLPLATEDARLRAAAERAGVEALADPAAGEGD